MPFAPLLSRVQKNQVADKAVKQSLRLADFSEWVASEGAGIRRERLSHVPTEGWFEVTRDSHGTFVSWWPATGSVQGSEFSADWAHALTCADRWMLAVSKDWDAVDLWALGRQQHELLAPATASALVEGDVLANRPFNDDERRQLKSAVEEIGRFIVEGNRIQGETQRLLVARFGYLAGAVDRLGRFDFKNVLSAVLLEAVVLAGLNSDAATALFAFASALIASKLAGFLPPG